MCQWHLGVKDFDSVRIFDVLATGRSEIPLAAQEAEAEASQARSIELERVRVYPTLTCHVEFYRTRFPLESQTALCTEPMLRSPVLASIDAKDSGCEPSDERCSVA